MATMIAVRYYVVNVNLDGKWALDRNWGAYQRMIDYVSGIPGVVEVDEEYDYPDVGLWIRIDAEDYRNKGTFQSIRDAIDEREKLLTSEGAQYESE